MATASGTPDFPPTKKAKLADNAQKDIWKDCGHIGSDDTSTNRLARPKLVIGDCSSTFDFFKKWYTMDNSISKTIKLVSFGLLLCTLNLSNPLCIATSISLSPEIQGWTSEIEFNNSFTGLVSTRSIWGANGPDPPIPIYDIQQPISNRIESILTAIRNQALSDQVEKWKMCAEELTMMNKNFESKNRALRARCKSFRSCFRKEVTKNVKLRKDRKQSQAIIEKLRSENCTLRTRYNKAEWERRRLESEVRNLRSQLKTESEGENKDWSTFGDRSEDLSMYDDSVEESRFSGQGSVVSPDVGNVEEFENMELNRFGF